MDEAILANSRESALLLKRWGRSSGDIEADDSDFSSGDTTEDDDDDDASSDTDSEFSSATTSSEELDSD